MNWYAASITYSMPDGTTQVLDGNTMKDWLAVDAVEIIPKMKTSG